MRFGLDERTIRAISAVLARHPAVENAVLHGSRAKGVHKPGSDIDLALFGQGLTQHELDRLLVEIDDLDQPYMVDLSIFDKLTHAELRDNIERVGVVFYQRAQA